VRCIAYEHSQAHKDLWTPCTTPSATNDFLCRAHRDALIGVFLGLQDARDPITEIEEARKAAQWAGKILAALRYKAPKP
jgi:hypothetical protein